MRSILIFVALLVGACASPKQVAEPQLAGGESPAAFQRAIGLTLLRTGQPRRALPYLERFARLEPANPEPRCFIGRAFMDMQMWQQARSAIEEAIGLDPKYAPAYGMMGVLFDARGDHRSALAAHRRAMALDPSNAAYRNNLGFSFFLDGKYVEAMTAYTDALRLGPNLQRIHNNLGFTFGRLGRIEDASEHFRLGGTPGEAANNLGIVYEERGDLADAYDAFADAVRDAPDLAAARGNLERVSEQLGKALPPDLEGKN